nr:MFS transporter [Chloroflexota bacterium]
MLATLRHKNVALLWSAGLISLTGDWLLLIALPIYVYTLTHSTALTSVTFIVEALPSVLLGSVAGVFVDRWDRRRTMVAANLAQATGLLPLLAVRSADQLWLVYTVSVVEAILALFFAPAEQSLLPTLVDDERLVAANALSALNGNLARLAGAPLGGLVAGLLGLGGAVVLDAASFLLSSLLILAITISTTESKVDQPDHAAAT